MTTGVFMGKRITSAENFKAILAIGGVTVASSVGAVFWAGSASKEITMQVAEHTKDITELKSRVDNYNVAVTAMQRDVAVINKTLEYQSSVLTDIKDSLKKR